MVREILFYKTTSRVCPVEEFLDSLPAKVAQKAAWVLKLLEDLEIIPAHYFAKMTGTDGIWECRIKQGSNIYRIFAFWDGDKIILTHGLMKKTQKTPRTEILRAQTYKTDYFNRKGG